MPPAVDRPPDHLWADPRTRWEVPRVARPWTPAPDGPPHRATRPFVRVAAIAAVVGLLAGFLTVTEARIVTRDRVREAAPPPRSPAVLPGTPVAVSRRDLLRVIGLRRVDVEGDLSVRLVPGGNLVAGQVTLDLCEARYASESSRTDRLQLAAVTGDDAQVASTEAVFYDGADSTAKAFDELRSAARDCTGPRSRLNAAPDAGWQSTPSVERLAYDVVVSNSTGQEHRYIAAYLRRGRILLAVYLPQGTGVDATVAGHTAPGDIVRTFAERLAALPAAAVG